MAELRGVSGKGRQEALERAVREILEISAAAAVEPILDAIRSTTAAAVVERMAAEGGPLLLTVQEAAKELAIGETSLRQMILRREIPHVRLGGAVRIPRDELRAWVAERTEGRVAAAGRR